MKQWRSCSAHHQGVVFHVLHCTYHCTCCVFSSGSTSYPAMLPSACDMPTQISALPEGKRAVSDQEYGAPGRWKPTHEELTQLPAMFHVQVWLWSLNEPHLLSIQGAVACRPMCLLFLIQTPFCANVFMLPHPCTALSNVVVESLPICGLVAYIAPQELTPPARAPCLLHWAFWDPLPGLMHTTRLP